MKVDVWAYRYVNEYGKNPRGRGWWFFENYNKSWQYNGWGNYSDVKKEAVKAAKESGIATIYTAI